MTSDRRDERGVTLVELVVVLAISVLILMLGFTILQSSDTAAANIGAAATNANDARALTVDLDDNLRYAADVWLCTPSGGTWTAGSCASASTTATPAAPSCTGTGTGTITGMCAATALVSESLSGSCTYWTLTSPYLVSSSASTSTDVMAGVSAETTSGFSLPSVGNLVEVDLRVDASAYASSTAVVGTSALTAAGNAASVHQLISPDNLGAAASSSLGPCAP